MEKVYLTRRITPEALVDIYKAVGRPAEGKVAIKISTGESLKTGFLRPEFIKGLVDETKGTIVECNTAYPGSRMWTWLHRIQVRKHGFESIAKVDIMDSKGSISLPVKDKTHIQENLVGKGLEDYDFMINLAHFKGHMMGGFGGVLKNASIGVASSKGKAYIHSSGKTKVPILMWLHTSHQDEFLESMAAAAQSVHDYFENGKRILYINVMYRMSVDCDCVPNPAAPRIADYGILASTDPVALDQACCDIVGMIHADEHNDPGPLLERIAEKHGLHTIEWAEKIGLGSREYEIVEID